MEIIIIGIVSFILLFFMFMILKIKDRYIDKLEKEIMAKNKYIDKLKGEYVSR